MSHCIIVNGAGKSADYLEGCVASVTLTYPYGGTCTCTNVATGEVLRNKGYSDLWFFGIPEEGEWTILCVNLGWSMEKTIVVDSEHKSFNIRMVRSLELIENGIAQTPLILTTAKMTQSYGTPPSVRFYQGANTHHYIHTDEPINLGNRSRLVCKVPEGAPMPAWIEGNNNGFAGCGIGVTQDIRVPSTTGTSTPDEFYDAYLRFTKVDYAGTTHVLDISNLIGGYYIGIDFEGSSSATQEIRITDLYLEE